MASDSDDFSDDSDILVVQSFLDMAESAQSAQQPLEPPSDQESSLVDNPSGHRFVDEIPNTQIEVRVDTPAEGSDYELYDVDARVQEVLRRRDVETGDVYSVRLLSGHLDKIGLIDLVQLPGGQRALEEFEAFDSHETSITTDSEASMRRSTRTQKRKPAEGYVDSSQVELSGDESLSSTTRKKQKLTLLRPPKKRQYDDSDSEDIFSKKTHGLRSNSHRLKRGNREYEPDASQSEDDEPSEESGLDNFIDRLHKSSRKSARGVVRRHGRPRKDNTPYRRSERSGKTGASMKEMLEDDIPEVELSAMSKPKPVGAKERFFPRAAKDDFRHRHLQACMTCGKPGDDREKGPLVFCQGCTDAYHSICLGVRSTREHLVTKVEEDDFVLQCRRCIDYPLKKDPTAPYFSKCQGCMHVGLNTVPFRTRRTPKEEQSEREKNGGQDPITAVNTDLLNNANEILFRCSSCHRAWHMHHLPAREETLFDIEDPEEKVEKRWAEYCRDFTCQECLDKPAALGGIVAWRPKDLDHFVVGTGPELVSEDDKEYLIKWHNKSYFQCRWMPGAWLWSVAYKSMLLAFYKRNDGINPPVMTITDAIPEEYLRVDIVFLVEYNNIVNEHIEEVDLARIREVDRAFVKYKGLGYDDVFWEKPPDPVQDPERWLDFKTAYEDWVRGNYVRLPASTTLNTHLRKIRARPFEEFELKEQPKSLTGGKMMDYQLEGLNWMYFKWFDQKNAILADEMGLGKTIQVIGLLSILQERHHCYPFLVVVPNATCANWKRELKQWAPSLRVVTYFGSARALELAERYELFHGNKKDLACHVVVTSYEAAQSSACQHVLRKMNWQAMVVDEGQRLKNDAGLLYKALCAMKAPFKLLLTGTPLQNRTRELLNLLQFLDPTKVAQELELEFQDDDLSNEKIQEFHNTLRPFMLRRYKAQVLDFLPPMAQIIVPVSMSSLQKSVYKSILAKNTELLRSVFGGERKKAARTGLRNILMQLRKCLCHPFVYARDIEERTDEIALSHQRLVEASSKLQLLEIVLPKLHERGHRVLIFSQFLDMLTIIEDFMGNIGLEHIRLDGSHGSLEKQQKIDSFNAEDSKIFAFLLSTRAGGVGINLATADTVIIMDPDFNPHQDIQAISRAHRIGQKKKVLVFQLMTRASAEEKIMQIGKKKMALEHALIESMETEEDAGDDLEAVLRFGAEALFKDDNSGDIRYDNESVEKLLDRSQIEDTKAKDKDDKSAESQFSFARVWQNERSAMGEGVGTSDDERAMPGVWDQIMAERARQAQEEAAKKAAQLGRGKRQRKDVDYHSSTVEAELAHLVDDGDTDFQSQQDSDDDDDDDEVGISANEVAREAAGELDRPERGVRPRNKPHAPEQPKPTFKPTFKRVTMLEQSTEPPPPDTGPCIACGNAHKIGWCPLKVAGYELCGLCGLAHIGHQRTCPHLNSETQVRLILAALEKSPEDRQDVEKARKKLTDLKNNLVQLKKRNAANAARQLAQPETHGVPSGSGAMPEHQPHQAESSAAQRPGPPPGFTHQNGPPPGPRLPPPTNGTYGANPSFHPPSSTTERSPYHMQPAHGRPLHHPQPHQQHQAPNGPPFPSPTDPNYPHWGPPPHPGDPHPGRPQQLGPPQSAYSFTSPSANNTGSAFQQWLLRPGAPGPGQQGPGSWNGQAPQHPPSSG